MSKREDDILDDILDGEETDLDEMKLPETLVGESSDEEEPRPAPADPEIEEELSKFLEDEKKEPDENKKKPAKELDREEMEREIREKIAKERKEKRKSLTKILVVCAVALAVVAAGLIAFFQISKASNNYIMKFDGKKISVEEFEFFMLLSYVNQSATDKQAAYEGLLDFLVLNKAAKDKNVSWTEEETAYIKYRAETFKSEMEGYRVTVPKISDERLEEIMRFSEGATYYKLMDVVAEEAGYSVDETEFGAELERYRSSDKLLKYIITETEEECEAAREALVSGMAPDEAVMQYSAYYLMYGRIEMLSAGSLAFDEENYDKMMALEALEFSEVIDMGGIYAVFIAATYEETRDWFRAQYVGSKKYELFISEYELWKAETKESKNEKMFESFDESEFFNRIFGM